MAAGPQPEPSESPFLAAAQVAIETNPSKQAENR